MRTVYIIILGSDCREVRPPANFSQFKPWYNGAVPIYWAAVPWPLTSAQMAHSSCCKNCSY